MAKRKRLTSEEYGVLRRASPSLASIAKVGTREHEELMRARRALVANLMIRRYSIAEMACTLAKPIESGGLGVTVSESTLLADIKYVRETWQSQARDSIRHGLADELAMLERLQTLAMDGVEKGIGEAIPAVLAVHDRKVRLLGLDLATRQKLMLDGDGPVGVQSVAELFERAEEARRRHTAEDVIDVDPAST